MQGHCQSSKVHNSAHRSPDLPRATCIRCNSYNRKAKRWQTEAERLVTWSFQCLDSRFWCGSRRYCECRSVQPAVHSVVLSPHQRRPVTDAQARHHWPGCGQPSTESLAAGPPSLVGIAMHDNNLLTGCSSSNYINWNLRNTLNLAL